MHKWGIVASAALLVLVSTVSSLSATTWYIKPNGSGDLPTIQAAIEAAQHGDTILCAAGKVSGLGEGWITAVTHSPALGHWIGLGFVAGGHQAWEGKTLVAADPVRKGNIDVEVVSPHMYDPQGERMHG